MYLVVKKYSTNLLTMANRYNFKSEDLFCLHEKLRDLI